MEGIIININETEAITVMAHRWGAQENKTVILSTWPLVANNMRNLALRAMHATENKCSYSRLGARKNGDAVKRAIIAGLSVRPSRTLARAAPRIRLCYASVRPCTAPAGAQTPRHRELKVTRNVG